MVYCISTHSLTSVRKKAETWSVKSPKTWEPFLRYRPLGVWQKAIVTFFGLPSYCLCSSFSSSRNIAASNAFILKYRAKASLSLQSSSVLYRDACRAIPVRWDAMFRYTVAYHKKIKELPTNHWRKMNLPVVPHPHGSRSACLRVMLDPPASLRLLPVIELMPLSPMPILNSTCKPNQGILHQNDHHSFGFSEKNTSIPRVAHCRTGLYLVLETVFHELIVKHLWS